MKRAASFPCVPLLVSRSFPSATSEMTNSFPFRFPFVSLRFPFLTYTQETGNEALFLRARGERTLGNLDE
jgi:hypothetical protein